MLHPAKNSSYISAQLARRLAIIYMSFWTTVLAVRISNLLLLAKQAHLLVEFGSATHFHHFILGFILLAAAAILDFFGLIAMEATSVFFGISLALIADEFLYWISFNFNYWNFYNYFGIVLIGIILLLLFIAVSDREKKAHQPSDLQPTFRKNPEQSLISVVIPAYNESAFIGKTLQSLAQQKFQNFEVIVVDNNSQDNTAQIAAKYGARVIIEKQQGVAHARQSGFSAAAGQIIATTDADTLLPANWTERIAAEFQANPQLVGFGGLYNLYSGPLSAALMFPDLAYLFWLLDRKFHKTWALTGSNMAVRKSAFVACGGFDTSVHIGEDAALAQKLTEHGQLKFDRNFLVSTSGRRYRHGLLRGAGSYLKKYKGIREGYERFSKKRAELPSERGENLPVISLLWPMIPAIILILIFSAQTQALAKSIYAARRAADQARQAAQQEASEFRQSHPQIKNHAGK